MQPINRTKSAKHSFGEKKALFRYARNILSLSDLRLFATQNRQNAGSVLPKHKKRSTQTLPKFGLNRKGFSALFFILKGCLKTEWLHIKETMAMLLLFPKLTINKKLHIDVNYFLFQLLIIHVEIVKLSKPDSFLHLG